MALRMSHSPKNPGRLFLCCPARICRLFQWADQEPHPKVRQWIEEGRHPSRDEEGYPKLGYDVVLGQPSSSFDNAVPQIPFDEALWNECQAVKFLVTDTGNIIAAPRELEGRKYSRDGEVKLLQDLYRLRLMAKLNQTEASKNVDLEDSQKA